MGLWMNGNDWIQSVGNYTRTATDHTVMYWLRLDDNTAVRRPFGNTGSWEARTGAGGNVLTSDYLQAGTASTITLTLGTYHHVAFVQDVTGANRFGYLDGQLVNTVNSATFSTQQVGVMSIGVSAGGSTQGWYGAIDDARVYDHAMVAEEIETIFACMGTDGLYDNLICWYPMDEGAEGATASTCNDLISGLDLTVVTGTPVYNYDAGIKRRRVA